jgi:hypothetical protein
MGCNNGTARHPYFSTAQPLYELRFCFTVCYTAGMGIFWRRASIFLRLTTAVILFLLLIAPEWPAFQDERYRLNSVIGQRQFDFVVWLGQALWSRGETAVAASHIYLDEDSRRELVLNYLDLVNQRRQLERAIAQLYVDPTVANPQERAAALEIEVIRLKGEIERWQPLAEAVVQEQVAAILLEEGFDILGKPWPPVQMQVTPLPAILIVSPRERIERLYGIPLAHGLTATEQAALETAVRDELDYAALVVPIGGLGIFPAMILETTDINFLADVVAHEWAHHWLTLRPLGIRYADSPAMYTINETVASIFGREVGPRVVARYYPDLLPPPPAPPIAGPQPEPSGFNFRGEMHTTRVRVDELLADGRIIEAEDYMEMRRRYFVANGYQIRKLNQAYFAFYGMYADSVGAAGADPIGPTVVALRQANPTLRAFMQQMGAIANVEDLWGLVE